MTKPLCFFNEAQARLKLHVLDLAHYIALLYTGISNRQVNKTVQHWGQGYPYFSHGLRQYFMPAFNICKRGNQVIFFRSC